MSWKLRIEYLMLAEPAPGSGAGDHVARLLQVQTLAGAGASQTVSDPSPADDLQGAMARRGVARVTATQGAAVVAWGDAPLATQTSGLRLERGCSELIVLAAGQRIAACEASDPPAPDAVRTLLSAAAATGGAVSDLPGGSYVWSVQGSFASATVKLQALGPDGAGWMDVASMSAPGATGVVLGEAATVRTFVSGGPPSGLFSTLS